MKHALRVDAMPTFEFKSSIKSAISYVVQALFIFLFASIDKFGFAISLALFCALVFARQNVLILSPFFILATCVFSLEWLSLAFSVTPCVVLIVLYVIFYRLKKNVPLFALALATLVGMTPYIVLGCVIDKDYLLVGISALIGVVLTFALSIGAYAIFVRGIVHQFTTDECMSGGIFIIVTGYALMGVKIYGFCFYDMVIAFVILIMCATGKGRWSIIVALLFGVGGTISTRQLETIAVASILASVALTFSPFTKWASALSMLAVSAILWLVEAFDGASYMVLTMNGIGIFICLILPKSMIIKLKGLQNNDNAVTFTHIVNRRGRELATRLYSASDVFYDLSKNLEDIAESRCEMSSSKLAKEVAKGYCSKCQDKEVCFEALGGDTSCILQPMCDAAINRGKVTILDMPPFVTSRCVNMHSLMSVINQSAESYKRRAQSLDSLAMTKSLMAQQFAGISLVLDDLARDCQEQVNFASDNVEMIKSELLKHNIVASEIVISGEEGAMSVTLLTRAVDTAKAVLTKILSRALKCKLDLVKVQDRGEQKLMYFQSASVYEVAYGIAWHSLKEDACGDSHSILCPTRNKRLFAICDGMGHGDDALIASKNAVKMIESFYRSNIDSGIILNLVNRLLSLSISDAFSSLDIAIVDTSNGGVDVIKLGAASSFIIRQDNIEVLSCKTPPCGILDEIESVSSRYQLYVGDMLVMMSDGVYDTLDNSGVGEMVDSLNTSNPQVLADALLQKALELGSQDDCTVLVLRLFNT